MDLLAKFQSGLTYTDFLNRYAKPDQRQRWDDFHAHVKLKPDQKALLASFTRRMPVIVIAGAWCGDCVNQCPMFDHFAAACDKIDVRYFDRDANPDLTAAFPTCGGARVPTVVFLSEDGHICGRMGDRTLSKYRDAVSNLSGAACSTGLVGESSLTERVVQDWLNEFERIQWMLRTSSRLRQLHGD
jgi:thiol-disulfide isomerase/thioredoxin